MQHFKWFPGCRCCCCCNLPPHAICRAGHTHAAHTRCVYGAPAQCRPQRPILQMNNEPGAVWARSMSTLFTFALFIFHSQWRWQDNAVSEPCATSYAVCSTSRSSSGSGSVVFARTLNASSVRVWVDLHVAAVCGSLSLSRVYTCRLLTLIPTDEVGVLCAVGSSSIRRATRHIVYRQQQQRHKQPDGCLLPPATPPSRTSALIKSSLSTKVIFGVRGNFVIIKNK